MGMLDIWVAKPGAACQVDDRDWVVHIADAHLYPYSWAGTSYAALPAPQAHWAGNIPPGTYVITATRPKAKPGEPNRADAVIVNVCCDGLNCVRLFVNAKPSREPPPPKGEERPPRGKEPTRQDGKRTPRAVTKPAPRRR